MNRIWHKHYEPGVATEIDISEYQSLIDILENNCHEAADKPAFANFGSTLTFKQLADMSLAFAAFLVNRLGAKKGDRIAIMMPNLLQYPVALFGILRAGCIVVNINPLYTAAELAYLLNDSDAKTIVILDNFAHTLQEALSHVSIKHIILTSLGDLFPKPKNYLANFIVRYVKRLVPEFNLPNYFKFNQVLKEGKKCHYERPGLRHHDIAFLQYTGGTTGISKGAILSHGNMIANVLQLKEWTKIAMQNHEQIMMTPLPLYHIFSLTGNLLFFMSVQSLSVLITNPSDLKFFVKEMKRYKFTAITGVNTLFNALVNYPDIKSINFSKLQLAISGGMASQKKVAEQWYKLTGKPLIEGYGLTEAAPLVCLNPFNSTHYTGSIGLPAPSTDVEIRDSENNPVAIGEEGELCLSGPQVMQGYWNDPEATANAFTEDGWLKTGDIAKMDEAGFCYLVDRKKDMIIVSGFNVYPNEVEDVIMQNSKVLEVAVIGVPYERTGEAVKAFVVKKDASLNEAELRNFCKQYLTRYKWPKFIEFMEELPKSNVGKILRKALRE